MVLTEQLWDYFRGTVTDSILNRTLEIHEDLTSFSNTL